MAVKPIRQVSKTITPANGNLVLLDDGVSMGKATLSAAVSAVANPLIEGAIDELELGTASKQDVEAFASAAQGSKADSAIQPDNLGAVATSNDYDDLSNKPTLGTAAATDASDYATAAEGVLAGTALQPADVGVSVGDMLSSAYDPNGIEADAFNSANHVFANIEAEAREWSLQDRGRLDLHLDDYRHLTDTDYTNAFTRIAAIADEDIEIILPRGDIAISDLVSFEDKNLIIRGRGRGVSNIVCTGSGGIDYLDTNTTNDADSARKFCLRDLSIIKGETTTAGNGGVAVNAQWNNTGAISSIFHGSIENVSIEGRAPDEFWNKAVRLVDCGEFAIRNSRLFNTTTTDNIDAAVEWVRDKATNITGLFFETVYFRCFRTALTITHRSATAGAGTVEGVFSTNCEFISVQKIIEDDNTDSLDYSVNGILIAISDANASRCGIDVGSLANLYLVANYWAFQDWNDPEDTAPLIAAVRSQWRASVWLVTGNRFWRNASVTDAADLLVLPTAARLTRVNFSANSFEGWVSDCDQVSGATATLDPAKLLFSDNVYTTTVPNRSLGFHSAVDLASVSSTGTGVGLTSNALNQRLQVLNNQGIGRWTVDANGPTLAMYKSRSDAPGTFAAVTANDQLAVLNANGDDGSAFLHRGDLACFATGTVSTGHVETYWRARWSYGGTSMDALIYFGGPGLIQFGGQTSGQPGIRANGSNLAVRRADDSAYSAIESSLLDISDGISAPSAATGRARIYVDVADGDLKVIFGDGTVKTIVTDT